MTTLQQSDVQALETAVEIDTEQAYQTVYATPYIEREASEAYNAEELLLEVV